MEEEKKRHKPILTILSAVSIVLLWVSIVLCLFAESTLYGVMLLVASFLVVVSLVLTIVSRKERFKKIWTALLIVDILTSSFALLSLPLLALRGIGFGMSDRVREAAAEKAKIENVLVKVPKTGLILHNLETIDSPYHYFDGDGSIAKQFTSLNFTFIGEGNMVGSSAYYFNFESETKVTFSPTFDSVCVSAEYGDLFGHHAIQYPTYGFSVLEGRKLKGLIDGRVKEQKEAYEKSREEAFEGLSFNVALEEMKESESKFICFYFDKSYEMGFTRVFDEERSILQAFSNIDPNQLTLLEKSPELGQQSLDYSDLGHNCPYCFRYFNPEKCLEVSKYYEDPYGGTRSVSLYYRMGEEEGKSFLKSVSDLVATKPIAY